MTPFSMESTERAAPLPWVVVAFTFVPAVVCAVALVRIRSGWGGRSSTLRGDRWGLFLTRLVYAIMPFTVALTVMAVGIGLIGGRLHYDDTGSTWSRVVVIGSAVVALAFFGWGVKEFYRPSPWRHRPPWLVEYERRHRRQR